MDKDRHKDKETEYDKNGNVLVERKWEWNAKSKEEIKRKEIHHAHDKYLRSEKEFDENGVPVQETVWFDGYMLVDTYKYGKRIVGMLSGPPAPPVFSAGTTLNGVVAAVPDQFAPGEVLAFRVVMLTGEVVANEATQLTNSMGGSMWTTTDQQGGVEVTIPRRWKDVGVDVLGVSTVIYTAARVVASAPMLTQVPALLQPGSLFTLHGDGFRPSMTGNVVSVGDATATVMGATPNALTVFAPATLKTGATPIRVTTNGSWLPSWRATQSSSRSTRVRPRSLPDNAWRVRFVWPEVSISFRFRSLIHRGMRPRFQAPARTPPAAVRTTRWTSC